MKILELTRLHVFFQAPPLFSKIHCQEDYNSSLLIPNSFVFGMFLIDSNSFTNKLCSSSISFKDRLTPYSGLSNRKINSPSLWLVAWRLRLWFSPMQVPLFLLRSWLVSAKKWIGVSPLFGRFSSLDAISQFLPSLFGILRGLILFVFFEISLEGGIDDRCSSEWKEVVDLNSQNIQVYRLFYGSYHPAYHENKYPL